MAAVWSDETRMSGTGSRSSWLAVEAWAACRRRARPTPAMVCRDRAEFTVADVLERERVTRHDVAAFVDVVAALDTARKGGGSTSA